MAGKGGKRPGAGRPKGKTNEKTRQARAVADRAIAAPVTPLDVMLEAMMKAYDAGELAAAHAFAKDAAPYVHPRLASMEQKHSGEVKIEYSDEARIRALTAFLERTGAIKPD